MSNDQATDTSRPAPSSGRGPAKPAGVGTVAGLIGAIPIIGPALLAGCVSCAGAGAAVGLGATAALPPVWWLAGVAATATGAGFYERHHARRCRRSAAPLRAAVVLVAVAAMSWVVVRFLVLPLVDWLVGGSGGDRPTGPILP